MTHIQPIPTAPMNTALDRLRNRIIGHEIMNGRKSETIMLSIAEFKKAKAEAAMMMSYRGNLDMSHFELQGVHIDYSTLIQD